MITYIDASGIAHEHAISEDDGLIHWYDENSPTSQWFRGDEVDYAMDATLTTLRQSIEGSVFVQNAEYWAFNEALPIFVEKTGYRPSGTISSVAFQQICDSASSDVINRYLYVQDVWWLADSLNAAHAIAAQSLAGYFREIVKVDSAFEHDGLFETMGMGATPVLKEIHGFVLALNSCLDIATKLVHALSHVPASFERLPSRIGGNQLFRKNQGTGNKVQVDGPLFEKCWETTYLGCLRDEIVHNRALDASGVVFTKRMSGRVSERFVLLPDTDEFGTICCWKNRRRFYSLEFKANDVLPYLYVQISHRMLASLNAAIEKIPASSPLELDLESARSAIATVNAAYEKFFEKHFR